MSILKALVIKDGQIQQIDDADDLTAVDLSDGTELSVKIVERSLIAADGETVILSFYTPGNADFLTNKVVGANVFEEHGVSIDGGGSAITTGSKQRITLFIDGTVTHWAVSADQSGSIVFDVKKNGTSMIGGGNKPTLSTAQDATAAVASWTDATIASGDKLEFIVDSATTVTKATLTLRVKRT